MDAGPVAVRGRSTLRFVGARLQIVTDADGRYVIPQARIGEFFVVAIPHNSPRTADGRVNHSGHGTFALAGMAPGTYFLQYREGPWPTPRGEMGLVSMATVVVAGRDISDVRVAPVGTVEVEGRLVVDAADRAQLPSKLTVGATPVSFDGNPGPRPPGTVGADLTFAFRTWPGAARIRVLPEDAGWTVRRVRYRGADVTDTGIDFKAGEKVSGVEVDYVRGR